MKKISLLVLSTVLLASLLTNCKHSNPTHTTSTIDSLQAVLNGHEKLFAEINVNDIEIITQTIDSDIDIAEEACQTKKLTITQEEGTFFGRYQALKSGLKKFGTRYNDIKEELAFTKKQLEALKAELTNGKLDEEAEKKYLKDEELAVANLGMAIEQIHGATVTVSGQFKNYRPKVLETLATLGKKG